MDVSVGYDQGDQPTFSYQVDHVVEEGGFCRILLGDLVVSERGDQKVDRLQLRLVFHVVKGGLQALDDALGDRIGLAVVAGWGRIVVVAQCAEHTPCFGEGVIDCFDLFTAVSDGLGEGVGYVGWHVKVANGGLSERAHLALVIVGPLFF